MKSLLYLLSMTLIISPLAFAIEPLPVKEVATVVDFESKSGEDNSFVSHSPVSNDTTYAIKKNTELNSLKDDNISWVLSHAAHIGRITAIEVCRSGDRVFTSGMDGKIYQHLLREDFGDKRPNVLSEIIYESEQPILSLALSPDNNYLAVAQYSLALVIDLETKEVVRTLSQVSGRITAVAWDPRSELLALGLANGKVYIWPLESRKNYKEDTKVPLEEYRGGVSSILSIVFHPAGRAFIVAERGGTVSLWRLLRTEQEMGLWDRNALVDQDLIGRKRVVFAQLRTRIEDVWLDVSGQNYYVIGADGLIYRWKLRGLKLSDVYVFSKELPLNMVRLNDRAFRGVFVLSGRKHRLTMWCPQPKNEIPLKLTLEESLSLAPLLARGVTIRRPTIISQSEVLTSVADNLSSGLGKGLLWASQKTGNLLSFDIRKLINLEQLANYRKLCH